jgi:hypothetical protein
MNTGQLVGALALAAILGGGVGGFVANRMAKADAPATKEHSRSYKDVPEDSDEGAEDEGDPEVEALRGRLASLERRVSLLTAALARGQAAPADGEADADKDPRNADVADPVFEAAVLDIVDRERERSDGERDAARAEQRAQRTARVSENLAGTLGLDEQQRVKVAEVITAHFDALRALRSDDNPERPVTPREWREKAAQIEQQLQENLKGVLSSQQLAAYQALEPDDQIGGGFGRSRPRAPRAEASAVPR